MVETSPGLFKGVRTKEDFRLAIHQLVLILSPLLITLGYGTGESWQFWTGLGFGLFDAVLSFTFSVDNVRKVLYALGGVILAVFGFFSIGDPTQLASIVGAVTTAIVAFVAAFYTPSSVAAPDVTPV